MVSPFLSFLGGVAEAHRGALQELRTERAKKEALEEQRTYEEEAQKRRLIFAEKLKEGEREKKQTFDKALQDRIIYNDKKRTGKVGFIVNHFRKNDDDYTTGTYARGRDESEDINNAWMAINRFTSIDENVQKLKANAPAYEEFLRDLRTLDARTKAAFTVKLNGREYQPSLLVGGFNTVPSSIVRSNKFLTNQLGLLENGNVTSPSEPPSAGSVGARDPITGEERHMTSEMDKALVRFRRANPGFAGPNQRAAAILAMTSKAGAWNPDEGKQSPVIYNHMNSPLGGMLMNREQLGDDQIEAGAQYIKGNFINTTTGGVRVNDINKFVDVAHNATYKEREDRGLVNVPPMTVGFAKGVKGSKIGAEIAEAKKVYQDSISLRRNLIGFRNLKTELGVGSDISIRFTALAEGAPQVAKDLLDVAMGVFSSAENRYTARLTNKARNYLAKENERIKGIRAEKGDLAAKAEAMKVGLAYQLAITFQGSGSGKTISDEDIRRQLVALSGNFITLSQANGKIDTLLGIVDNKIANASLFANLKDTDNIGKYYAAQRVQKMINTLTPDEVTYNRFVSERVESKSKGELPLSEVSSGAQAARVLGRKYPKATVPLLRDWYGNNVQENDRLEIAREVQGNETRNILLNQSAANRWFNEVKGGVSKENLNKTKQELQRGSGFGLDLNTGTKYKLIYQDDGKVSTFEKPEEKPVTGLTGSPIFTQQRTGRGGGYNYGAMFNKIRGNN